MATILTKPIRILASDHQPLRLIAGLEQRTPAEVIHEALAEYFAHHGESVGRVLAERQRLITAGDLEGLTRALERDVDESMLGTTR